MGVWGFRGLGFRVWGFRGLGLARACIGFRVGLAFGV